jgi:hypothetical protein
MEVKVEKLFNLIKKENNKTNKSLEDLVNEVDKKNKIKLLYLITIKLADEGYDLVSTDPVRIKSYL